MLFRRTVQLPVRGKHWAEVVSGSAELGAEHEYVQLQNFLFHLFLSKLVAGQTKYNLTRTIRVILDLITVKFLHTYLTRPMHVMGLAGLGSMGLGALSLLAVAWMKYCAPHPVNMTGNPLLLLSALLELVGVQFISMGLLGELLARTYFESQGKSAYVVRATLNLEPYAERRRAA